MECLFWSVIIISYHSSLFPCRRLWVELYLVFLKCTSLLALPWASLALVCIKTWTNYGMFLTNSYLPPPPQPSQKKGVRKHRSSFTVQKSMESSQKKNKFGISLFVVDCSTGTETAAALKDRVCNLSAFKKMDFTAV